MARLDGAQIGCAESSLIATPPSWSSSAGSQYVHARILLTAGTRQRGCAGTVPIGTAAAGQ